MNHSLHRRRVLPPRFPTALLAAIASLLPLAAHAAPPSAQTPAPAPVTLYSAVQYDMPSKLNGQTYRLMVFVPPKADPAKPLPVVYLLDGNYYFGAACDAMPMNELRGMVVAIGYPVDDRTEIVKRRTFDLSLPNASGSPKYGGGDVFLSVIEKEIKPFINSRYAVDTAHQTLLGHSLGALMVVRDLFQRPTSFSTFVAASPSIWWNSRAVLADEPAFSKKAAAGELHMRVLILSASDEQYHGTDPALLAKAHTGVRMIDNATELAARLSKLDPSDVKVTREIISDETHRSGAIASICRGLQFALETPK